MCSPRQCCFIQCGPQEPTWSLLCGWCYLVLQSVPGTAFSAFELKLQWPLCWALLETGNLLSSIRSLNSSAFRWIHVSSRWRLWWVPSCLRRTFPTLLVQSSNYDCVLGLLVCRSVFSITLLSGPFLSSPNLSSTTSWTKNYGCRMNQSPLSTLQKAKLSPVSVQTVCSIKDWDNCWYPEDRGRGVRVLDCGEGRRSSPVQLTFQWAWYRQAGSWASVHSALPSMHKGLGLTPQRLQN